MSLLSDMHIYTCTCVYIYIFTINKDISYISLFIVNSMTHRTREQARDLTLYLEFMPSTSELFIMRMLCYFGEVIYCCCKALLLARCLIKTIHTLRVTFSYKGVNK